MKPAEAEPIQAPEVMFRRLQPEDRGFFASGWLRSFRGHGPAVSGIQSRTYHHYQQRLIQRLIQRGRVDVAADPADPSRVLFGFACWEWVRGTCILHYVYVRGVCRGRGVGTALVNRALDSGEGPPAALVWTHRTTGFDAWARRFADRERSGIPLLYNPYLVDKENH